MLAIDNGKYYERHITVNKFCSVKEKNEFTKYAKFYLYEVGCSSKIETWVQLGVMESLLACLGVDIVSAKKLTQGNNTIIIPKEPAEFNCLFWREKLVGISKIRDEMQFYFLPQPKIKLKGQGSFIERQKILDRCREQHQLF